MRSIRVTAYRHNGGIYLQPHIPQAKGPDRLGAPCLKVEGVDAAAVGQAVQRCISEASLDADQDLGSQLVSIAGAKTLKAFQRASQIVSIDATRPEVTFWPTKVMGVRKGYVFIDGPPSIVAPSPLLMGERVLQAFDMCE